MISMLLPFTFFFFNDTATTEIYTLSLHDALPISGTARARPANEERRHFQSFEGAEGPRKLQEALRPVRLHRSEEHTSELQSPCNLVCRLLLEKKKKHLLLHLIAYPQCIVARSATL